MFYSLRSKGYQKMFLMKGTKVINNIVLEFFPSLLPSYYYLCLVCTHDMVHMCSEKSFWVSLLSFHCWGNVGVSACVFLTSQQLAPSFLTVLLSLSPSHSRRAGSQLCVLTFDLPLSSSLLSSSSPPPFLRQRQTNCDCSETHTVDQLASNSEISSPLPPECSG